jgi:hypothetical protein
MKWFAWFFCLALLVVSYAQAFAADQKVTTQITMIFTGHEKDQFGIHTVHPTEVEVVVDDEGCVADRPKLIGLNIKR